MCIVQEFQCATKYEEKVANAIAISNGSDQIMSKHVYCIEHSNIMYVFIEHIYAHIYALLLLLLFNRIDAFFLLTFLTLLL